MRDNETTIAQREYSRLISEARVRKYLRNHAPEDRLEVAIITNASCRRIAALAIKAMRQSKRALKHSKEIERIQAEQIQILRRLANAPEKQV